MFNNELILKLINRLIKDFIIRNEDELFQFFGIMYAFQNSKQVEFKRLSFPIITNLIDFLNDKTQRKFVFEVNPLKNNLKKKKSKEPIKDPKEPKEFSKETQARTFGFKFDGIFNDWVITHVYYYLLLYIPVMLFRRFTILLSTENDTIGELIWDILYKKESCIYALPKDHRKLFDVYIANGIKTVDLGPPALLDFDVSWFINKSAQFIYNEKENLYYNGVDRSLELLPDKKLVYRHTNHDSQQEVDEEWYVIAVKYHYSSEGKYEIIIHNN